MRPQPLICVKDVEASSRWYQRLLGCESAHGGTNYERLVAGSRLVLQLHRWELEHHHGPIGDPDNLPPGNGLLLWFEVDDIDAAIARAEAMGGRGHSASPSQSAGRRRRPQSLGNLAARSGRLQGRPGKPRRFGRRDLAPLTRRPLTSLVSAALVQSAACF